MTSSASSNAAAADEASEMAEMRRAVNEALAYLTDRADVESTPGHAIGHAVTALRRVRPKLRTRAEVDAEIAHEVRYYARMDPPGIGPQPSALIRVLNKLCAEPVRAERCLNDDQNPCGLCSLCRGYSGSRPPLPEADPEPCGCEQAEALQAEVGRLRALTEDRHAPNTLEWRQLVDELRGEVHGLRHRIKVAVGHLRHRECCTGNVYVATAIEVLEAEP